MAMITGLHISDGYGLLVICMSNMWLQWHHSQPVDGPCAYYMNLHGGLSYRPVLLIFAYILANYSKSLVTQN